MSIIYSMHELDEYYRTKLDFFEKKSKKVDDIKEFIYSMQSIKYVPTADYIFDEIIKIIDKD